ncbi:MAG: GxxExxY protein [Verrucomicrobiota bacterium]
MKDHIELISKEVVDSAFKIHVELGPGLLESVYEHLLSIELKKRGFKVIQQKNIPLLFDGKEFEIGFRADLWIEPGFIVELKSTENIAPVHLKQLLTYLRLTHLPLGLLINFGEAFIKNGIRRVANTSNPKVI